MRFKYVRPNRIDIRTNNETIGHLYVNIDGFWYVDMFRAGAWSEFSIQRIYIALKRLNHVTLKNWKNH